MDLKRIALASHPFDPAWPVAEVKVVRLEFQPGQATGLHFHPMPVLGYVAEGAFIVQQEGGPARRYEVGQSLLEPAHAKMLRFDNASQTQPAALIAAYLVRDEKDKLIEFLER